MADRSEWACARCTLVNPAAAPRCGACEGPRPVAAPVFQPQPQPQQVQPQQYPQHPLYQQQHQQLYPGQPFPQQQQLPVQRQLSQPQPQPQPQLQPPFQAQPQLQQQQQQQWPCPGCRTLIRLPLQQPHQPNSVYMCPACRAHVTVVGGQVFLVASEQVPLPQALPGAGSQPGRGPPGPVAGGYPGAAPSASAGSAFWKCFQCGLINQVSRTGGLACASCRAPRPGVVQAQPQPQRPQVSQQHHQHHHGLPQALPQQPQPHNNAAPDNGSTWSCQACTLINPGFRASCSMCGTARGRGPLPLALPIAAPIQANQPGSPVMGVAEPGGALANGQPQPGVEDDEFKAVLEASAPVEGEDEAKRLQQRFGTAADDTLLMELDCELIRVSTRFVGVLRLTKTHLRFMGVALNYETPFNTLPNPGAEASPAEQASPPSSAVTVVTPGAAGKPPLPPKPRVGAQQTAVSPRPGDYASLSGGGSDGLSSAADADEPAPPTSRWQTLGSKVTVLRARIRQKLSNSSDDAASASWATPVTADDLAAVEDDLQSDLLPRLDLKKDLHLDAPLLLESEEGGDSSSGADAQPEEPAAEEGYRSPELVIPPLQPQPQKQSYAFENQSAWPVVTAAPPMPAPEKSLANADDSASAAVAAVAPSSDGYDADGPDAFGFLVDAEELPPSGGLAVPETSQQQQQQNEGVLQQDSEETPHFDFLLQDDPASLSEEPGATVAAAAATPDVAEAAVEEEKNVAAAEPGAQADTKQQEQDVDEEDALLPQTEEFAGVRAELNAIDQENPDDFIDRSIPLAAVRSVLPRSHLLAQTALEVFVYFGNDSFLFNVPRAQDDDPEQLNTAVENCDRLHYLISRQCGLATYGKSPAQLWRESGLLERWQRGQLSNFDYLMHLNQLAGRSLHDITQYPVFPWVLRDYTSPQLDLRDPRVFRDLSRPIGAQTEASAQSNRERYELLAALSQPESASSPGSANPTPRQTWVRSTRNADFGGNGDDLEGDGGSPGAGGGGAGADGGSRFPESQYHSMDDSSPKPAAADRQRAGQHRRSQTTSSSGGGRGFLAGIFNKNDAAPQSRPGNQAVGNAGGPPAAGHPAVLERLFRAGEQEPFAEERIMELELDWRWLRAPAVRRKLAAELGLTVLEQLGTGQNLLALGLHMQQQRQRQRQQASRGLGGAHTLLADQDSDSDSEPEPLGPEEEPLVWSAAGRTLLQALANNRGVFASEDGQLAYLTCDTGSDSGAWDPQSPAAGDESEDPDGAAVPPFMYAGHFSTPISVCHFLVRLPLLHRLGLQLNDGVPDHPERLFRSVPATWALVSGEEDAACGRPGSGGGADVRELVPQFYASPDFLVRPTSVDLGVLRATGEPVGDVELPPWAGGSPKRFAQIMRAALESRYVSERLHLWIDLVFGFRQQGPRAVEAANVFFHLSYAGRRPDWLRRELRPPRGVRLRRALSRLQHLRRMYPEEHRLRRSKEQLLQAQALAAHASRHRRGSAASNRGSRATADLPIHRWSGKRLNAAAEDGQRLLRELVVVPGASPSAKPSYRRPGGKALSKNDEFRLARARLARRELYRRRALREQVLLCGQCPTAILTQMPHPPRWTTLVAADPVGGAGNNGVVFGAPGEAEASAAPQASEASAHADGDEDEEAKADSLFGGTADPFAFLTSEGDEAAGSGADGDADADGDTDGDGDDVAMPSIFERALAAAGGDAAPNTPAAAKADAGVGSADAGAADAGAADAGAADAAAAKAAARRRRREQAAADQRRLRQHLERTTDVLEPPERRNLAFWRRWRQTEAFQREQRALQRQFGEAADPRARAAGSSKVYGFQHAHPEHLLQQQQQPSGSGTKSVRAVFRSVGTFLRNRRRTSSPPIPAPSHDGYAALKEDEERG